MSAIDFEDETEDSPEQFTQLRTESGGLSTLPNEVRKREARALELHRAGVTATDIAIELGYADHSAVSHLLKRVLSANVVTNADEVRAAEISRIDGMLGCYWPKAKRGDYRAAELVLKLMDRRARYLGLDSPIKIEVPDSQAGVEAIFASSEGVLLMAQIETFMATTVTAET